MDSFHKPSALSFDGNTSENWRRFKQQFDIYITASGSEQKDDAVKIAILLNFAGEDAIEVFNTFQFAEGDEKKLNKVLEQFEQYCNPRKNVVFERHQFWQITQKDSETVDQFVTRLKNKVKSCEYPSPVDDMVRDKFVFSIRDLQVKERLLREEKLTLEKAISMARASEASKEQIKAMGPNEQNIENPTVNEIRAGGGRQEKNPPRRPRLGSGSNKGKCTFCGSSHSRGSCPALGKTCDYCQKRDHFAKVCRKRLRDFGGKTIHAVAESEGSDNEADLLTFSVESSDECPSQDDWHVSLTIADTRVNFKLDSGADCNVISKSLLARLPVGPKQTRQCKAKLKVYDGRRITPSGKISLTCEYKGKFTVLDFILIEQDLPSILGLKSCLELGLIKRIYHLQEENLESEYADVFEGLGEIKGVQHKIQIDPNATPVVHPPRRVPVALREPLKEELHRMEKLGVIKKCTEPTAWVHSLVVAKKKNNKLRVCLDPSDLNRAVMREHFPMQTVEDVISRMPNAKVFSVLDANHGFWQVKLAKDSSKLATFNTPFGRYSYTRLPFGIASAPEVFQNVMVHLFQDIEGVEVIVDDLVVWGEDAEQHDVRLRQVLDRCRECNLKLNREKCHFRVSEVHYVGHVLSADGVKPDPQKVEAIIAMPTPANREDLQRFLGVVTYLSKFIPNMSQKSAALRQLLQKDVEWSWGQVEEDTFTCLKTSISSAPVLKFFDPKEPVTLSVDASSKGVGAVLLQNDRPVAYASKALTLSQENYAQIEKEMLAIVFGCERFHDYLYGQREITVESDHKPLEAILKKPIHQAPLRLQKMILRLKPYAVNVKYIPGSHLVLADALSRAYLPSQAADKPDEFEIHVLDSGQLSETMFHKLRDETKSDPELQQLQKVVMSGWPQTKVETPVETRPYWNYRDEISCYEGLMFKGDRIIVPHSLRPEILQRIHAAHLGIEKCRARARSAVFWPGINSAIDDLVSKCSTCQQHQRSNQREPLIPQEVPERPWVTVAADIFYYKGRDYLLVVDYFSKYPEVARLSSKNSEAVIMAMKDMFARHGIPERLIADNMPFNSVKFKDFASKWEIEVVTSSPHYPRSNGLVERNVQTVKQLLRKADESKQDAFLALLEFRNSPISGMDESPAELLMSRKLRTRLPTSKSLLQPQPRPTSQIRYNLLTRQQRQKAFYDRGTRPLCKLHEGEPVRMKRGREWTPAVVVKQHQAPRSYIVATPDGTQMRRNRFHLQPTKEEASPAPCPAWEAVTSSDESNSRMQPSTDAGIETPEMGSHPNIPQEEHPVRRSLRIRRPPQRLIETI